MLRERALLTMKLIDALDAQVTTRAFLRSLFWLATAFGIVVTKFLSACLVRWRSTTRCASSTPRLCCSWSPSTRTDPSTDFSTSSCVPPFAAFPWSLPRPIRRLRVWFSQLLAPCDSAVGRGVEGQLASILGFKKQLQYWNEFCARKYPPTQFTFG